MNRPSHPRTSGLIIWPYLCLVPNETFGTDAFAQATPRRNYGTPPLPPAMAAAPSKITSSGVLGIERYRNHTKTTARMAASMVIRARTATVSSSVCTSGLFFWFLVSLAAPFGDDSVSHARLCFNSTPSAPSCVYSCS